MLPSRLNLLSPDKMKRLNFLSSFQFVKNILEFFLIIVSIGGIVLLGGQIVLEDFSNELDTAINSLQSQHADTNKQINNINSTLSSVEKIQKEFEPISHLIPELAEVIPENILLKTMIINKENNTILIDGQSPTRETLLELQKSLSSLDWIDEVEIPISQLTEKENINFSFQANIIE